MKNLVLFLLSIVLLFSACKDRPSLNITSQATDSAAEAVTAKPDTVYQSAYIDLEPSYDTTQVKRGEDIFLAYTEAISLNDSSIIDVYHDEAAGKVYKSKNHNVQYKLQLFRNGKSLFTRTFTKHDFQKLEKNGYLNESGPQPPILKGVTVDDKVVFDLIFVIPDTDVGGIATLITDFKGTPLLLQNYSHTGGGGCDSEVQVSSNGQYVLNCETLYGPNNYTYHFGKPDVVYASFLTDTSFVVIYDYLISREYKTEDGITGLHEERNTQSNNLVFYHVNGNRLASYRYDGYFETLGYSAPVGKSQGKFILLGKESQYFQIVDVANPIKSEIVSLKAAKKLSERIKKPSVDEVHFYAEGRYFYLYYLPDGLHYYATDNYEQ